MATYVNDLRLKEIGTGESSGTWGTETNVNLELIGDAMGLASKNIANASTATITMPDGTATNGELRSLYLKVTGGGQACTVTLAPNTINKVWFVENNTNSILTMSQGSGANVAIAAGQTKAIATDGAGSGAAVFDVLTDLSVAGDLHVASTVNVLGDTAAGDKAAIGYASADGIVVTGQGSTSDVTLKNDADGDVLTIPTGTTNIDVVGDLTAGTLNADGATSAGDNATIGYTSALGLVLTGQGSTNDITLKNDADAAVLQIPTGTTNATFVGTLGVAGGSSNGVAISQGAIKIKNGGAQSYIDFYCESNNAHYARILAPAHSAFSGNITLTLPASTDTLAGIAATQTLTNKTLTTPILTTPIANAGLQLKNAATSAGFLEFFEDSDNGTNKVTLIGPASTADVTVTLPASTDTLVGKATTDTLTNKTLTTPNINGATSAGDDAALGYTSALGLVLTGQGSTNDITLKNDADANVLTVPTGTTNVAVAGTLSVGGAAAKVAGLETIYVPAAGMYPETTNGSSDLEQVELSNGPELKCLDFAAAADDFAQFQVIFPKSWNEGTVTFQAFFTVTGTNTGTVAWGLAGRSFADSADLNTAFGTQVVATAKAHSGTSNDIDVAAVSGNVTIAGAAADTLTIFQIARDVSADSQTGAARLLGIKLFFTTDAANDA
mgnify:CR=1 FL=1